MSLNHIEDGNNEIKTAGLRGTRTPEVDGEHFPDVIVADPVDAALSVLADALASKDNERITEAQKAVDDARTQAMKDHQRRKDMDAAVQKMVAAKREADKQARAALERDTDPLLAKVATKVIIPAGRKQLVIRFAPTADEALMQFATEALRRAGYQIARVAMNRRTATVAAGTLVPAEPWLTQSLIDSDSGLRPAIQRGVAVVEDVRPKRRKKSNRGKRSNHERA